MKIAFIAVNYNNWHITSNFVSNVKGINGYSENDIDIVIVDNASKPEDYKKLKKEIDNIEDVHLVRSDNNRGYFGGLNLGIDQIKYSSYDYIVAGNNDLFFTKDFLSILSKKKYKRNQTVIVPDLVTVNGIHQNPQFVKVPSKKRQIGYKIYYSFYPLAVLIDAIYSISRKSRLEQKKNKDDVSKEIFQCTGAVLIIRPEFFSRCGMLDDSLFLWGEEVALAHQLVKSGDKMLYDPELCVIHMENASVGNLASYSKYKIWKKSFNIYKNYYYM